MECGSTRNVFLQRLCKSFFRKTTSIEIQCQHWGVNRQLSMEGIAVKYFPNSFDTGKNEKVFPPVHIQAMKINNMHVIHVLICFIYYKKYNMKYDCLACQQYGETQMVVPSNICVVCIYI